MFQWTVEEEISSKASVEAIWNTWQNVEGWPEWDHELEWCKLNGPFEQGSTGQLKPKGWPITTFVLTRVTKNQLFENESNLPFTKLIFTHELKSVEGESQILHRAKVKGLLAPILWFTMGLKLQKGLKSAISRLSKLAESSESEAP